MLFGDPVSILHLANRAPNRQHNADTVTHAYSSNLVSKLADQKIAWQLDMYPFQLFHTTMITRCYDSGYQIEIQSSPGRTATLTRLNS